VEEDEEDSHFFLPSFNSHFLTEGFFGGLDSLEEPFFYPLLFFSSIELEDLHRFFLFGIFSSSSFLLAFSFS